MPFVPFKSTRDQASDPNAVPAFTKKKSQRKRKTGKVAPAQKALMNPGRAMGGGSR